MGNRRVTRLRSRRMRRHGMSPYQRHKKTPHRYTTKYHEWRAWRVGVQPKTPRY